MRFNNEPDDDDIEDDETYDDEEYEQPARSRKTLTFPGRRASREADLQQGAAAPLAAIPRDRSRQLPLPLPPYRSSQGEDSSLQPETCRFG